MPSLSRSMSYRSKTSLGKSYSSGKNSGQFYVILGLLLFIIIVGSVVISIFASRREFFTNPSNAPSGTLIYLYMKECKYCKDFNNIWAEIETAVNSDKTYKFKVEKYDLNEGKGSEYASKNKINYAPAILFETSGGIKVYDDNKDRTKVEILKWASSF